MQKTPHNSSEQITRIFAHKLQKRQVFIHVRNAAAFEGEITKFKKQLNIVRLLHLSCFIPCQKLNQVIFVKLYGGDGYYFLEPLVFFPLTCAALC